MATVRVVLSLILIPLAASVPYKGLANFPLKPFPKSKSRFLGSAQPGNGAPYCIPGQACWPSPSQWSSLNASVNGALIAVTPPLASCFAPFAPGNAECIDDINNFTSSYWRASLPGAMQSPNLEQDPVTGDDCFDAAKPCRLGNIAPFAVAVTSHAQVRATLAFAQAHNIKVVIKSSGHEYQGRSTAKDALLVWTHALRGITTSPSFTACAGDSPVPALTAMPGDSWGDVYPVAEALGYSIVGGSEISVSACGGYTLSGGHSWQGPAYGMAVDNVLQMSAVLVNGTGVVASRCSHSDLFWALRGGGGSSFAVVTSATYALHPIPVSGVAGATITLNLLRSPSSLAMLLDAWMKVTPFMNTAAFTGVVVGGYVTMTNTQATFLLSFNGTTDQANAALAPISQWATENPLDVEVTEATVSPFPSLLAWHESWDTGAESTGAVSTIGSRLVPRSVMLDDSARERLAINLTVIVQYIGGLEILMVAGGAVAVSDPASTATSITPAWREAGFHVVMGAGWALNATLADQQSTINGISDLTGILRTALPDSGAYWGESDLLEPDWQDAFWGAANYARLQGIKALYDPKGVISCWHCVELPTTTA